MKRILILTTCLLSGLMAASEAASLCGDQDYALPSTFASSVSLSKSLETATLSDFSVPGGWGDKDILSWQKQNPDFVGLRELTFRG